jgi:hypothetical protein
LKKALTLIIAAAALVVPAAQATFDASLPAKTSHTKITKAIKAAKQKAGPSEGQEHDHDEGRRPSVAHYPTVFPKHCPEPR